MTYEANGCKFIRENDQIISWEIANNAKFEPITSAWMFEKMAERGGQFVDVGASTGWFTVPMAARGYEVHAIEPNTRVLPRLHANIALNEVQASVYEVAASDQTGTATFIYNPSVPLTSGGSLVGIKAHRKAEYDVQTIRVDDLGLRDVGLIKIDVEGHELAVLKGAVETIARCRPYLVLEANTRHHEKTLTGWCEANGYTVEHADERNLLCAS